MRRVVYDRFGPPEVLHVVEAPEPEPGPGEILVDVRAAGLNPKDVLVRKGKYRWLSGRAFPRGCGYDWAGEVRALGPEVTGLRLGDPVYGMANGWAGGSCAERFVARANECAPMPPSIDFVSAAAIPLAAQTALQALRDLGKVEPGQRVALLGASGGVGVFAVQIARALGAEITASAGASNLDLLRELGAQHVVDYRSSDVLAGGPFDVIFDIFGNRHFEEAEPALDRRGHYVSTVPSWGLGFAILRTLGRSRRAHLVNVRSNRADLFALGHMVEAGQLRAVIDSTYSLDQIAAAHARIETKHARGKVVVVIEKETPRRQDAPS